MSLSINTLATAGSDPSAASAASTHEVNTGALASVDQLPVISSLPDPLLDGSGKKIVRTRDWAKQRLELKKILTYYALGTVPPPPGNVIGTEVAQKTVLDGKATCHMIHLNFGPQSDLGLDLFVYVPNKSDQFVGPFPTIVQPSFSSFYNNGDDQPQNLWDKAAEELHIPLSRGYVVATFYYQQGGADKSVGARETGYFPAYPAYDWADLAAWAWTMSRCVDYLQSQPYVDPTKFIALGHSRLGKAALVAGAYDERFALVAPCGSGCAGTGAYRFNGAAHGGREGLAEVEKKFPQWLSPNIEQFVGNVDKLPFDQNWLIALVAPRCFIAAEGYSDTACTGNATVQSFLGAQPVYTWLKVPTNLGIHYRPGGHMLAPDDWTAVLDFADIHLRHMKLDRDFTVLPSPDQLH